MKKSKLSKKLLLWLLTASLLLGGCSTKLPPVEGSSSIEEETLSEASETVSSKEETKEASSQDSIAWIPSGEENIPPHADINFEDMVYERPDLQSLYDDFDQVISLSRTEGTKEELFTLYQSVLGKVTEISKMSGLATIHNYMDLSNSYYEEEMNLLDNELSRIDNRMNDITEAILTSPYGEDFANLMGEDYIARYERNQKLNSPEIEDLLQEVNGLVTEYNKRLSAEYSTIYQGKEVTLDTLDFTDPNVAQPYYEIYAKKNAACGEIYTQLVKLRIEIARILGYDNYTDYAYDSLGRDYTKEEAAAFSEQVKETIVPLYLAFCERYEYSIQAAKASCQVSIKDGIPCLLEAFQNEFSPSMTEAMNFMLDHHLYIMDSTPQMMPAGFTTLIDGFGSPFLYINTSVYTDPATLFHEFGHYHNFYLMGPTRWNDSNNLDLAEVHSQGLEVLMFDYYEDVYDSYAEQMKMAVLLNLLYSIVSGCCEDTFQQAVFENPDMTLEEMNELHAALYTQYIGFPVSYEWVDIHHHFQTPFYYISYATSAVSAFEIWELAQEDRTAALKAYESVAQNTINCGYLEPLEQAGLRNPFSSDLIKDLADHLQKLYLPEYASEAA